MANPLSGILDPYMAQVKPAATEAGRRACSYAERIISRLDVVIDRLESDVYEETHRIRTITIPAGGTDSSLQVPSTDDWELMSVVAVPSAATTLTITNGVDNAVARDLPVLNTFQGNEFVFKGGSQITAIAGAGGGITLTLVFKLRRKIEPIENTGQRWAEGLVPGDIDPSGRQEAMLTGRHSTTIQHGTNVIGERAMDENAPGHTP